ncbi:MAG: AMP-binding enzyme, partial [Thermomicrobiales bacterium]
IINRGGGKIVPAEVDDALLHHPAVAAAAVFAVPDPRLGEDIVAAVVLNPGTRTTARELRGWMLDRLSPYKVPRRIWFVDDLPRTMTGKVRRGELARRWSEDTT